MQIQILSIEKWTLQNIVRLNMDNKSQKSAPENRPPGALTNFILRLIHPVPQEEPLRHKLQLVRRPLA